MEEGKITEPETIHQEVAHVLTALRLFKAGELGAETQFAYGVPGYTDGEPLLIYHPDYRVREGAIPSHLRRARAMHARARRLGDRDEVMTYHLRSAEILRVVQIWDALRRADRDGRLGRLRLALRRFNQIYDRSIHDDRLVDSVIALESCLLSGDTNKGEQIASRGAALLANERGLGNVSGTLRTLYKARNDIVHDGETLGATSMHRDVRHAVQRDGERGFVERCENITRAILRTCVLRLRNGETLEDI